MIGANRRSRAAFDVWPGLVDALASILLVSVFMLLVFVLGQYALGGALSSRERALDELAQQVQALAETLALERRRAEERDVEFDALRERRRELEGALAVLEERLRAQTEQTETATGHGAELGARVEALNEQVRALREQLALIASLLESAERSGQEKDAKIEDLGRRLNIALAYKAEELARYRSEFFGRLRQVLGEDPNVRVVGDRFVFQSELLFPTGSDELSEEGKKQIAATSTPPRAASRPRTGRSSSSSR